MERLDAHRVWLGYRGGEAFAFGLGWTVAPIFFVRELGLSPLELVLAGTALELAYFAFEIPTGIVADTYGRRRSTILGVLGLGLGFVATGFAGGVGLVLAAVALALVDLRLPIVVGGLVLLALAGALALVMPETGFVSARGESTTALASMAATARQGGSLI